MNKKIKKNGINLDAGRLLNTYVEEKGGDNMDVAQIRKELIETQDQHLMPIVNLSDADLIRLVELLQLDVIPTT